ncbi:13738_t:CDS:2 [Entrophospora sp. SA101]|nr:13738_t:CDS:2 [Entrophospora sp. SA101]CAJ0918935.1 16350_t:CDS:2 [Entrophospora sp. SA101]
MTDLENQMEMIKQGTHPELLARIEEIEKRKKQRLEMIMAEKRFTVQLIEKDYKADEFVAHCEFNSEKRKFKKRKLEELEDLRCRIKTEKRRIDVLDEEEPLNESEKNEDLIALGIINEDDYAQGDAVLIIDSTTGRYTAKFITATDSEVVIQKPDGSKTRLQINLLREGKYEIRLKES